MEERVLKIKLLSYLFISSLSFSYLILPEKAGISVPIFVVVQFICLFFIVPNRKPLLIFIPIFILALNAFISGNDIWRGSNFLLTIALYALMVLMSNDDYEIGQSSAKFILDIARNIFRPLAYFKVPVKWSRESNEARSRLMKRILIGFLVSIPCLVVIIVLLSSADEIFSRYIGQTFKISQSFITPGSFFKLLCSLAAGFYLFGFAYLIHQPPNELVVKFDHKFGDFIIINIVLFSILSVYTIFTAIQFKYLFANSDALPYGLSYTYYARRGFFELLFLSGVNIFIILLVLKLTREEKGLGARLTKYFCCCLCLITLILLASSFYRMWLYNADSGLTRLRFLVFGFLIFEAVGLLFTFIYIIRPQFNIIVFYLLIGLSYYLLLNLIPMDAIIAKSQIDRYLANGKGDIEYVLTLSSDAASQISRLSAGGNARLKAEARKYFNRRNMEYERFSGWQKLNLSAEKCRRIYDHEKVR